ncbi:hypothetical protein PCASD_18168 [Puccinia coronata f. sp. avenae]|uniref:ATP-dependent DNA helicase n=1 Tax=Puccinia coronata f. sp. avenae TaxID=200324 RepID=A0A2N5TSS4_9BASI|nr:hypothetical protein PCASD_18168 [Puccinia coronata f. sp. avenae]
MTRPARDLYYHEVPTQFYWTRNKGPTSFVDLKTVDGRIYPNFRSAAEARNLLWSDAHYQSALREASLWMLGFRLREMFSQYLVPSPPSNPQGLLDQFIKQLSDDCRYILIKLKFSKEPSCAEVHNLAKLLIQQILTANGKTMSDVGLDPILTNAEELLGNVVESIIGIHDDGVQSLSRDILRLNKGQGQVFTVLEACLDNGSHCLKFIDGPAGTGKTFLLNTIIAMCKSRGMTPVVVASSGVAAMLLKEGTTAHSGLRIPVSIHNDSTCSWSPRSALAAVLSNAAVLIWDEISMSHRHCLEAVDRSLQELRNNNSPFGGLNVILGGDFRQTLPVVLGGV